MNLGTQIKLRESGNCRCDSESNILWFSERSEALLTYALCGFSNFASIGIMIGAMTTMAPKRNSIQMNI